MSPHANGSDLHSELFAGSLAELFNRQARFLLQPLAQREGMFLEPGNPVSAALENPSFAAFAESLVYPIHVALGYLVSAGCFDRAFSFFFRLQHSVSYVLTVCLHSFCFIRRFDPRTALIDYI